MRRRLERARSARTVVVCCIAIACAGCDLFGPQDEVQLRIQNSGAIPFEEVTLFTQDGPRTFADLDPGRRTEYFRVSKDYGYATTYVVVQADTVILQVIDFVGAEPIDPGDYTYLISLSDTAGQLSVLQELRRD